MRNVSLWEVGSLREWVPLEHPHLTEPKPGGRWVPAPGLEQSGPTSVSTLGLEGLGEPRRPGGNDRE